jgi:hypothetical protein
MKLPFPMVAPGGAGGAIAAVLAIALVVYMVKQAAGAPPQNSSAPR